MDLHEKEFPIERTATMGGVILIDPITQKPYKAGVTVQQVDGGFDSTGLATEDKQDTIVSAINDLVAALQPSEIQEVVITDDELPPVAGQATAANQDSILAALGNLAAVLDGTLKVSAQGTSPVSVDALPLPTGAATGLKQDTIISALTALQTVLQSETLDVSGSVGITGPVTVSGSVELSNSSLAVTPSGTFNVAVPDVSTSTKQDAILTALGNLLTSIQAPQAITDNGGSITVDGVVGISGTVPVTLPGTQPVSLSTVPTHAVSQSGSWTFTPTGATSLTTTPTAISVGTTSVQIIGSQSARRSLIVQNMGGTTLFLSFATTASATAPTFQVQANGWMVIDRETWTGAVTAVRASGSDPANVIVTTTA